MNSGIFLSFGTNLGDRIKNLETARLLVEQAVGKVTAVSSVFKTAPWGKTDQPDFYNQAVGVTTVFTATELLKKIQNIELQMGRVREIHWGPRVIDIDILLYQDQVVREQNLTIPHSAMANRRFVLVPLAEIAGDVIHPSLKKNIQVLLEECADSLSVEKVL